jgi:glutamate dehydrogenase (NAD(P)+)
MNDPVFESLDGQFSCIIEDSTMDLKGFIVIDSSINGRAAGGLRIMEDTSFEEIKDLARNMTLKFGFLGFPQGGAKSGIVANGENLTPERKMKLLKRFADIAKPLLYERRYVIGPDMNTSAGEIDHMLESMGEKVVKRTYGNSGYYTALSVLVAALQSAEMKGIGFKNSTAAIEGFGSVGSNVAKLFSEKGIKITAVSTSLGAICNQSGLNVRELLALKEKYGNSFVLGQGDWKKIALSDLLELPCDFLVPAARGKAIGAKNASRIQTKIVCPGANIPVTLQAERILKDRGILSMPCFVSNCGAVLGGAMEFTGISLQKINEIFFQQLSRRIRKALQLSIYSSEFPRRIIEAHAIKNFARVKRKAEEKNLENTLFWNAVRVFKRSKIIPEFLVRAYSERYFIEMLETW